MMLNTVTAIFVFPVSFIFISVLGVVAMWLKPNRHPAVVSKNSIICFCKIKESIIKLSFSRQLYRHERYQIYLLNFISQPLVNLTFTKSVNQKYETFGLRAIISTWTRFIFQLKTLNHLLFFSTFLAVLESFCQARVQVPNPLSQQAPNPDPKVRPSLKNPRTQFFGLG